MSRYLSLFIVLIGICSQLQGMEAYRPQPNDILRFNIGGYKMDTTYQTVKDFGGHFFNQLISDDLIVTRDIEGRIFIDRPQKEAEYIQNFMLTLELPTNFNRKIAISAAKFFGIEAMEKYIEEKKLAKKKKRSANKKPKMSEIRQVQQLYHFTYYCQECNLYQSRNLANCIIHLTDVHKAKIVASFLSSDEGEFGEDWILLYRVPLGKPEGKK
jgi:hypothetical protein